MPAEGLPVLGRALGLVHAFPREPGAAQELLEGRAYFPRSTASSEAMRVARDLPGQHRPENLQLIQRTMLRRSALLMTSARALRLNCLAHFHIALRRQ